MPYKKKVLSLQLISKIENMKKILNCVEELGEGRYTCYKTKKFSLEREEQDMVDYDDKQPVSNQRNGKFAETDHTRKKTVLISDELIQLCNRPIFSFFLDGSRHVYKIDDMAISGNIYPLLAGQIIVGCCERENRDVFKKFRINREIVLALPEDANYRELRESDFCKDFCEKINTNLQQNTYVREHNLSINDIFLYSTVQVTKDKDEMKDKGTAKIQDRMIQLEQEMVAHLCKENKLDDEHYLIKDGSLEYRDFNHLDNTSVEDAQTMMHYQHVVGISKMFNPDLLTDYENHSLSKTIASLRGHERTKVYRYSTGGDAVDFAVWYVRIRREVGFRETNFSDVIKCEMVVKRGDDIETDLVNTISANLIREASPACHGKDFRWGNHLYPVFLTETFCKANYIDKNIFLNLF